MRLFLKYLVSFLSILYSIVISTINRPVGRGVRGGSLEPTFGLQKLLYTTQTYISALPFESGSLVSLLLRITGVQTSLVTAMRFCSWRTSAAHVQAVYATAMKGCA